MNFFNSKQFWIPVIVLIALIVLVFFLAQFVTFPGSSLLNYDDTNKAKIACMDGDIYDYTTGNLCPGAQVPVHTTCQPGDIFNMETGEKCAQ